MNAFLLTELDFLNNCIWIYLFFPLCYGGRPQCFAPCSSWKQSTEVCLTCPWILGISISAGSLQRTQFGGFFICIKSKFISGNINNLYPYFSLPNINVSENESSSGKIQLLVFLISILADVCFIAHQFHCPVALYFRLLWLLGKDHALFLVPNILEVGSIFLGSNYSKAIN